MFCWSKKKRERNNNIVSTGKVKVHLGGKYNKTFKCDLQDEVTLLAPPPPLTTPSGHPPDLLLLWEGPFGDSDDCYRSLWGKDVFTTPLHDTNDDLLPTPPPTPPQQASLEDQCDDTDLHIPSQGPLEFKGLFLKGHDATDLNLPTGAGSENAPTAPHLPRRPSENAPNSPVLQGHDAIDPPLPSQNQGKDVTGRKDPSEFSGQSHGSKTDMELLIASLLRDGLRVSSSIGTSTTSLIPPRKDATTTTEMTIVTPTAPFKKDATTETTPLTPLNEPHEEERLRPLFVLQQGEWSSGEEWGDSMSSSPTQEDIQVLINNYKNTRTAINSSEEEDSLKGLMPTRDFNGRERLPRFYHLDNLQQQQLFLQRDFKDRNGIVPSKDKPVTKSPAAPPATKAGAKKGPPATKKEAPTATPPANAAVTALKGRVEELERDVGAKEGQLAALEARGVDREREFQQTLNLTQKQLEALVIVLQYTNQKNEALNVRSYEERQIISDLRQKFDWKEKELMVVNDHICKLTEAHTSTIHDLNDSFETRIKNIQEENALNLQQFKKATAAEIEELKRQHAQELEALKELHHGEIDKKHREFRQASQNKSPHDLLVADVQSLEAVVEMRSEEIRDLRRQLIEFSTCKEDLSSTKERERTLQLKVEDLEAQLQKSRADKRAAMSSVAALESSMAQMELSYKAQAQVHDQLIYKLKHGDEHTIVGASGENTSPSKTK